MKILQLCCFTNHWNAEHDVESHDIKFGKDIFDLPDDYGKNFDLIVSAPPCRQFTIANTRNWQKDPVEYIDTARKCLTISEYSGKPWILENVIGRIDYLIPELRKYRIGIWRNSVTTKKHLIFSNHLVMLNNVDQKNNFPVNRLSSKREYREAWDKSFVETMQNLARGL